MNYYLLLIPVVLYMCFKIIMNLYLVRLRNNLQKMSVNHLDSEFDKLEV